MPRKIIDVTERFPKVGVPFPKSCQFVTRFQASDRMIRRFTPSPRITEKISGIDKTDLTQSVLGLQFWVTSEHFRSGKLRVKCSGQIPSVYSMESDTFVVGEHDGPQHKVLQATSSANRIAGNQLGKVY